MGGEWPQTWGLGHEGAVELFGGVRIAPSFVVPHLPVLPSWEKESCGPMALLWKLRDKGRKVSFSRAWSARRILGGEQRMRLITAAGRERLWKMGFKVWARPEGEAPCTCLWVGWLGIHRKELQKTGENKRKKALPHTRQAKVGHSLTGLGGVRRRGYGGGYWPGPQKITRREDALWDSSVTSWDMGHVSWKYEIGKAELTFVYANEQ